MGRLTTHILNTATGKPGAGISVELFRLEDTRTRVDSFTTNADGRCDAPLLDGDDFVSGTYELVFHVGDYFATAAIPAGTPPFLNAIPVRFCLSEDRHYHIPLLVSPWSYSTYRGS